MLVYKPFVNFIVKDVLTTLLINILRYMKKILFVTIITLSFLNINAQDTVKSDTAWKFGGQFILSVTQASFTDWAAGGQNTKSGNSRLSLFGNYVKGKTSWVNNLDLAYGLSKQEPQKDFRKNDDLLELNSIYGHKASDKWYYSAMFNAKTQFTEGRKYLPGDSTYKLISQFASPLNINFAIGMDYKPNKYASVFLSPINSRIIYVHDDSLSTLNSLDPGQNLRYELGFIAKMKYQKDLLENVNLMSKLDLFADYLHFNSMKDLDVSWEVLVTMKVYKLLSINLNTNLIWDNNIKSTNKDGTLGDPKVQFKEIFGAGISYKF
jgi:hypothetical protein